MYASTHIQFTALRRFEGVDGSFYGRSLTSPSPYHSHQGGENYGLAVLRDPARLEFSLCVVQRRLGEYAFHRFKFPLPVVGEGWGEQSVLSLCYVSQNRPSMPVGCGVRSPRLKSSYGRSFAPPSPYPSHQGRGICGLTISREPNCRCTILYVAREN
jgi:hypothetical protein